MKYIRTFFRVIIIYIILMRYRLDQLVFQSRLSFLSFLIYLNPFHYIGNKSDAPGKRLRMALEKLGPIYVKFGQLLSTRKDLLPLDMANELAALQDQTTPFPGEIAQFIIETSLGKKITDIFATFSLTPLASASIAQVHAATLLDGREVVVKVLRPKVEKQIERDIEVLYVFAKFARKYLPRGDKLKPDEIVEEFKTGLHAELDLTREAANAGLLRRQFMHSEELYIPEMCWDLTCKNVLVCERIEGISIDNVAAIKAQGTDLSVLAERVINVFFTQVFKNNFFHGDMHPGNLFVSKIHKEQIIAVDFGITGSLTESDRRYIAENLLAFFHRNYLRVAELHIESGWVDRKTRVGEFEAAIRTVSEPVFEKPLKDISMGQLILNLFRIAREFQITIQPQLILLQKTLLNVEGLARQLDPEMDLWRTAKPFLEKWLAEQMGFRSLFKKVRQQMPYWIEKMPDLPELVYKSLQNISENQTPLRASNAEVILSKPTKNTAAVWTGLVLTVATAVSFTCALPIWLTGAGLGLTAFNWFYLLVKK